MIWGRSRCLHLLAACPVRHASCPRRTLLCAGCSLHSHRLRVARARVPFSRRDGIRRKSAEATTVFWSNHNAGIQATSLGLFWLKTSLSLRWVELHTDGQTAVNIYSALRSTDVAYLSTTPKRQT